MELGLNFEEDNEFQFDKASQPSNPEQKGTGYKIRQCKSKWFDDPDSSFFKENEKLKYSAEMAYVEGRYEDAIRFYEAVLPLTKASSMGTRRDVMEGLARSHLKLENHRLAEEKATALHSTSHENNIDHLTVSHGLLAEVYRILDRHAQELEHLAKAITIHPFYSDNWMRLGLLLKRWSKNTEQLVPAQLEILKKHTKDCYAFCFIRTLILTRSVQKTVLSFAKAKNVRCQKIMNEKIRDLKLSEDVYERFELFASMDLHANRYNRDDKEDDEKEEFQDLGSSKRASDLEKSATSNEALIKNLKDSDFLINFQNNWFSFIVE